MQPGCWSRKPEKSIPSAISAALLWMAGDAIATPEKAGRSYCANVAAAAFPGHESGHSLSWPGSSFGVNVSAMKKKRKIFPRARETGQSQIGLKRSADRYFALFNDPKVFR